MDAGELSRMLQIFAEEGVDEVDGIPVEALARLSRGDPKPLPPAATAELADAVLRNWFRNSTLELALERVRQVFLAAAHRGDLRLTPEEAELLRPIWGVQR